MIVNNFLTLTVSFEGMGRDMKDFEGGKYKGKLWNLSKKNLKIV